jgi:hypothetical protein
LTPLLVFSPTTLFFSAESPPIGSYENKECCGGLCGIRNRSLYRKFDHDFSPGISPLSLHRAAPVLMYVALSAFFLTPLLVFSPTTCVDETNFLIPGYSLGPNRHFRGIGGSIIFFLILQQITVINTKAYIPHFLLRNLDFLNH